MAGRFSGSNPLHRNTRRRGLTLLELVVVMGILVVLAGVLVPLLPGLLSDAHFSSGATTIDEMNKSIATYEALNRSQPDGFDLLVDSTGSIPDYCSFAHEAFAGNFSTYALTDNDVESLASVGIANVYTMLVGTETGFHPTFNCTEDTPTPITAGMEVVRVEDTFVQERLGYGNPLGTTYVVFGVGERCTMVGAKRGGITEAPVKGGPDAEHGPDTIYGRCGLVYRLDSTSGSPASLVAACLLGKDGLVTSERLTTKYYNNQR